MFIRTHEYTPIAWVVLAFIVTTGVFRLGADGHHRRFPLCFFHTGSGVNHPTHDADGVSLSAQSGTSRVVRVKASTTRVVSYTHLTLPTICSV